MSACFGFVDIVMRSLRCSENLLSFYTAQLKVRSAIRFINFSIIF